MSEPDSSHLFVKDIPLDATMSDVASAFEPFGQLTSVKFVAPESAHAGRAFISFADSSSGVACLQQCRQSTNLVSEALLRRGVEIRGQAVIVLPQKSRDEILNRSRAKDKRNLHLSYEGHITPDSPAAVGVSHEEMAKRKRLWDRKLAKLNDTNNKVSTTRLAVFNLPATAGTGQIRKIFAVAPKKYARTHKSDSISKVVQSRPIRITEVRKVEGQDGLAFLEFTLHEHALAALRQVNNIPGYFEDRRLIVEFAIENSFATKDRRKKQEDRQKVREKRFSDRAPPPMVEDSDDDGGGEDDE
jgi:nucleolar protein 4